MKYKAKSCEHCGIEFFPTGPAGRFCKVCSSVKAKEARLRSLRKRGINVGAGSGNYEHKNGAEATAYKNGIKAFSATGHQMKEEVRYCERCGKDLLDAKFGYWTTHHRDHDRTNNVRENFELLCKRCHQIEHDCYKALLKGATTIQIGVGNSVPEAPDTQNG